MAELAWTAYVTLLNYKSFKSKVWQKIVLECFFTMFMFFGLIQNSKMISTGGDNHITGSLGEEIFPHFVL
jgi:hypothetical protein